MELAAVKRLDDALPHDEVQKTSIRSVLSREMCTRTRPPARACPNVSVAAHGPGGLVVTHIFATALLRYRRWHFFD